MTDFDPPALHFVLTVTPETPARPWHARLLPALCNDERHFDSPLELMRHLAQLQAVDAPARAGGLK